MQTVAPKEQIDFETNKRLLNRYRFVEYEMLRILAGWLPAIGDMDLKLAVGRQLWEDSQHVQHVYQRLREVQTPAFRPPGDSALEHLMEEAIHAPGEREMVAGLFRVIKPAMVRAYRDHIAETFANPDAPTLYALKHTLIDEEEHVRWAQETLAETPTGAWEAYVAGLLAAAGGITGQEKRVASPEAPAARRTFAAPRKAVRDGRFNAANRKAGQVLTGALGPDVATRRRLEFESYSQEMLAAETVALVIYLTPEMPWEFTYDCARHLYDETRHCRLGIEWMEHHGLDYRDVPQNTRIYEWRSQYDAVTQYTMLTMGNEVHAFPYRHESIAAYRPYDDRLSIQFITYDMADERTHVAYGKKWIPVLLEKYADAIGNSQSSEQFIVETVARWEAEYRSGLLPIHE